MELVGVASLYIITGGHITVLYLTAPPSLHLDTKANINMVDNTRPFQCEMCDLAFTSKQFLKRHYAVHTDLRNYECSLCSRSYKYKKGLNRHYKIYHPAYYSLNIKGINQGAGVKIEEGKFKLPLKQPKDDKSEKNQIKKAQKIEKNSMQSNADEILKLLVFNEAKIYKTNPFPS